MDKSLSTIKSAIMMEVAQTEEQREYKRRYYLANREKLLAAVKARQEAKHEEYLAYQRRNRVEKAEEYRAKSRAWKAANKERHLESSRRYSREHAAEISEKRRAQRRALKQTVIDAYGGACACCGETALEFLTIDHVNGDGADHRRLLGSAQSRRLYEELVAEAFPAGFRALCFNCNSTLGFYGYCPHHPEITVPINRGVRVGAQPTAPLEA